MLRTGVGRCARIEAPNEQTCSVWRGASEHAAKIDSASCTLQPAAQPFIPPENDTRINEPDCCTRCIWRIVH